MYVTFSTSPWLLFLIIPLLIIIFALVFVRKRRGGRISANLILSTALQCLVAICFVLAISGMRLEYDEKNTPKEAVVLVDTSYSASMQHENMNDFVHDVLKQSVGKSRVCVVLFGHKQNIALNMTEYKTEEEAEQAYQKYLDILSTTPRDDATDIGAALRFVWDSASSAHNLIADPSRARIVILSDGLETDGDAVVAMKQLARNGVQVETSFYADNYFSDASILEVSYPQNNIYKGDKFNISVTVKSSHAGSAELDVVDKDEDGSVKEKSLSISLRAGTQKVQVPYTFENEGFHELTFHLSAEDDEEEKNNIFCSYFEVTEKNKILILETHKDEATELNKILDEVAQNQNIEIFVNETQDAQDFTALDFAEYNEVILYNFAVDDLQLTFQNELEMYVNKFGGGLFTVGGFEKDEQGAVKKVPKESNPDELVPQIHSYKESDMIGSVLADMLPVRVEAYKPAVATVFVFDVSSSMTGQWDGAAICTAAEDARYIIDNVLEPKDYLGIITLQDSYTEMTPLSPLTKKDELKQTITELEDFWQYDASTKFGPALKQASQMLTNVPSEVARKHIILFSDGMPGDSLDVYGKIAAEAYESQDITLTVVTYYLSCREFDGVTYYFNQALDRPGHEIKIERMKTLAGYGGGSFVLLSRDKTVHGVAPFFIKDLQLEQLDDLCYKDFHPRKGVESKILENITGTDLDQLTLHGYFASRVKIDDNISAPLLASAGPLYAEWMYGKGKVGSILIDLEGVWSQDLLHTETGKKIVENIVTSLLMTVDVPQKLSFEATLSEKNLQTQVNIFNLQESESDDTKIVAMVQPPDAAEPMKYDLGALVNGSRFTFENSHSGVYTVYVMKVPSSFDFMGSNVTSPTEMPDGAIIEMIELHKAFSYSKEYDGREDPYTTGKDLLSVLSTREVTEGEEYSKFIYDASDLFAPYGNIHSIIEIRYILLITAMVLYLTGIVCRLFKIKKFKKQR